MAKQTFTTGQVLTAAQMTSLQQTAMLGGAASAKTASYTLVAADAGTAISMSNASATTITVNTALFAAGDTVQITNLGAGVCTITAGTATVNTSASLALAQYESGTLDFTSTSAAIFIKGAGAGASGGMTVISSGSLTGSSIDITGISGYNNLQLILKDFYPATNGSSVRIRLNNNSTGTPYYKFWTRDNNTTDITNSDNAWFLDNAAVGQLNSSTKTMCVLDIYDVTNTVSDKMAFWNFFYTTTASTDIQFYGNARYKNQLAITQVNIAVNSGNFGGGSYVLYGVK